MSSQGDLPVLFLCAGPLDLTRLELGTSPSVCKRGVALGIAITYLLTGCPRASALPSLGLTLMVGRGAGALTTRELICQGSSIEHSVKNTRLAGAQ